MGITIFLAKFLGLYFLIVAVLMIFRKKQFVVMSREFVSSKSALAISAAMNLALGLVIVIEHQMWDYPCGMVITILGYLMIIKGALRYAFPGIIKKIATKTMDSQYLLCLIILLGLGIYLTWCGFTMASMMY